MRMKENIFGFILIVIYFFRDFTDGYQLQKSLNLLKSSLKPITSCHLTFKGKTYMQLPVLSIDKGFQQPKLSIKRIVKIVAQIILSFIILPIKRAYAALNQKVKINGWDLYGRVPYDDWLFSNWKLTDPNLLKKSMNEALILEIPEALSVFSKKKAMYQALTSIKGVILMASSLIVFYIMYRDASRKRKEYNEREKTIMGFNIPSSAKRKGSKEIVGKSLDDSGGFIDVSGEDTQNDNDEEEDEEDDEKNKGPKSNKDKKKKK